MSVRLIKGMLNQVRVTLPVWSVAVAWVTNLPVWLRNCFMLVMVAEKLEKTPIFRALMVVGKRRSRKRLG